MIEAKVICDSIGEHSPRLFTVRATNPKFIHQETLRHRTIYIEDMLRGDYDFSLSVSSARAIPFPKLLAEVSNPNTMAKPSKWTSEQKGMSGGDELSPEVQRKAEGLWENAAMIAGDHANMMAKLGVHKSIVNRIIEPYFHVHALYTATEPGWMNFFGLRLDKAADDTIKALAEACWICWNESQPKLLKPGEWHLPFVETLQATHPSDEQFFLSGHHEEDPNINDRMNLEIARKVSTSRCARLSYTSFETGKRSTIEEDLKLYDRLINSRPIHASPAEHQATPDECDIYMGKSGQYDDVRWRRSHEAGNLGPGWRQYRKMLPAESIAPLPEGY